MSSQPAQYPTHPQHFYHFLRFAADDPERGADWARNPANSQWVQTSSSSGYLNGFFCACRGPDGSVWGVTQNEDLALVDSTGFRVFLGPTDPPGYSLARIGPSLYPASDGGCFAVWAIYGGDSATMYVNRFTDEGALSWSESLLVNGTGFLIVFDGSADRVLGVCDLGGTIRATGLDSDGSVLWGGVSRETTSYTIAVQTVTSNYRWSVVAPYYSHASGVVPCIGWVRDGSEWRWSLGEWDLVNGSSIAETATIAGPYPWAVPPHNYQTFPSGDYRFVDTRSAALEGGTIVAYESKLIDGSGTTVEEAATKIFGGTVITAPWVQLGGTVAPGLSPIGAIIDGGAVATAGYVSDAYQGNLTILRSGSLSTHRLNLQLTGVVLSGDSVFVTGANNDLNGSNGAYGIWMKE